ncbi:hypothetical protein [uncultured Dialister sp.]|uniref:hypothetical protein n=1 Tax=uncultured Dialister sp. TaxID=278064 RepID=UPI00265968BC|nr:hypothetical protein [uncultured Dialister sp.]
MSWSLPWDSIWDFTGAPFFPGWRREWDFLKSHSLLYKVLVILLTAGGIYFSFYYSLGSRLLLLRIPNARSIPVTLWTFTFGHLLIMSLYAAGAYYVQKFFRQRKRRPART